MFKKEYVYSQSGKQELSSQEQYFLGRKVKSQIQRPTRHPLQDPRVLPQARTIHRGHTAQEGAA